jgi:hypothetical protein
VGRLLSGRLALMLPNMAALSPDELQVVLTEYGDGIWEWEICRQGEPLPARMRDGPFKSHDVALQAGKIALQKSYLWRDAPSSSASAHTVSHPLKAVLQYSKNHWSMSASGLGCVKNRVISSAESP